MLLLHRSGLECPVKIDVVEVLPKLWLRAVVQVGYFASGSRLVNHAFHFYPKKIQVRTVLAGLAGDCSWLVGYHLVRHAGRG